MAAPTSNVQKVKRPLAKPEPSTHGASMTSDSTLTEPIGPASSRPSEQIKHAHLYCGASLFNAPDPVDAPAKQHDVAGLFDDIVQRLNR